MPTAEQPQQLCQDAGYGYDLPRRADPPQKRRRWVVEWLHSWLNHSRRLPVRWEKLERTYLAFVQLACALLYFLQCDRLALRGAA
jgi:hypothetical protein